MQPKIVTYCCIHYHLLLHKVWIINGYAYALLGNKSYDTYEWGLTLLCLWPTLYKFECVYVDMNVLLSFSSHVFTNPENTFFSQILFVLFCMR